MLVGMVARRSGDTEDGSRVMRWRWERGEWRPLAFVPVADHSAEPSLVRDRKGRLVFLARGGGALDNDVRIWRSNDGGATWGKIVHARGLVSSAPLSLNRAADGSLFVAANLYDVFMGSRARLGHVKDAEGRPRIGGTGRNTLCLWPLDADETALGTPIILRDCAREFGAPSSGSVWRNDHPSALSVWLADGAWHTVLATRLLDYDEVYYAAQPTRRTGTYLDEILCAGKAIPLWNF
jgi:hypothetical protein